MERAGSSERGVAIVGAGVSGLSCARELHRLGRQTVVFERSRGVGGRCATRRVDGQPVDHGVAFYHGDDPRFLAAVRETGAGSILEGWPRAIRGTGRACQPRAFRPGEARIALGDGVNAFPKRCALGLDVRRQVAVTRLEARGGAIELETDRGDRLRFEAVVLALAAPQARALLEPLSGVDRGLDAARAVVAMGGSVPCLTVLAGYDAGAPAPPWDIWYPEDSPVLQLLSHDSAKRVAPRCAAFVFQALPAWSRSRLDGSARDWMREVLDEAGRLMGGRAASPAWAQSHVWRYARADHGSEFAGPIAVALEDGGRLGVAGESFAPGGGVQAAWLSGRRLARRLHEARDTASRR